MLYYKKSQQMSIGIIIAAVIGLLIIVIVIAMLSGKLGDFSKNVRESGSCLNACSALGKTGFVDESKSDCDSRPGTYVGKNLEGALTNGCCCT